MRGVPRQRPAISASAGAVDVDAEHDGRAREHLLELLVVVELQVGGEAEPVAQRVGQQPRSGRRADQRERREIERDATSRRRPCRP